MNQKSKSHLVVAALTLTIVNVIGCQDEASIGGGAVRGQIVLAGAATVDDAVVTLVGPTVRAAAIATDGTFAIDALPGGAYTLFVEASATREERARRELIVTPPAETVLEPLTFSPIARVRGRFVVADALDHQGTTITASDGSVASTTASGDFELAVGLAAQSIVAVRAGSEPRSVPLSGLARGQTLELGAYTLTPGATTLHTLLGTVRVAGATDPSGVEVRIDALGLSATTDALGHYVIPNVPAGVHDLALSRGAFRETLTGVLIGAGDPRVLHEGALYELAPVELAAGKRLDRGNSYHQWPVRSMTGRWVASFRLYSEAALEIWDTTTDTIALHHPMPAEQSSAGQTMYFDGEQVIFVEQQTGANVWTLRRADPLTQTVTVLHGEFNGFVHAPRARATITVVGWGQPVQSYAIVPWDGSPEIDLGEQETLRAGPTSVLLTGTADSDRVEWRGLDGALRQSANVPGTITYHAFASSGDRVVFATADHLEVWSDEGIIKREAKVCTTLQLFGDVVWCHGNAGSEALRLADLTSYSSAPFVARPLVSADGTVALLTKYASYRTPKPLSRVTLQPDGSVVTDDFAPIPEGSQIVATADGFWIFSDRARFIPRTGTAIVEKSALIQQVKVASDGALLFLDSEAASGSDLHRLTIDGIDTVLAQNVVGYEVVGDHALYTRFVGDRTEVFLSRPSSDQQLALGPANLRGLIAISATDFYVTRQILGGPVYGNGLFRLHLP